LLLIFDFVLPRLWCRRICPLGASQELLAWPRRLHRRLARCEEAESDSGKSIASMGTPRRWFFAACFGGAGAITARVAAGRSDSPPLRPPGAVTEEQFAGLCIRCGNCAQVCPSRIIEPEFGESGVAGLLAPKLSFEADYCREDCHRCNLVCPSGAIARISLEEKRRRVIGPAVVNLDTCLLAEGGECTACIQHCPYEAVSILTGADGFSTEPWVDLEKCTGCGACEVACPVRPRRAIRVQAAADRDALVLPVRE
jgi:ferredoxin